MSESKRTIKLLHNGVVLLEGDIDELQELGDGYTRLYQFDCDGIVELRIIKEAIEEGKPT